MTEGERKYVHPSGNGYVTEHFLRLQYAAKVMAEHGKSWEASLKDAQKAPMEAVKRAVYKDEETRPRQSLAQNANHVIALIEGGKTSPEIARQFNVTPGAVRDFASKRGLKLAVRGDTPVKAKLQAKEKKSTPEPSPEPDYIQPYTEKPDDDAVADYIAKNGVRKYEGAWSNEPWFLLQYLEERGHNTNRCMGGSWSKRYAIDGRRVTYEGLLAKVDEYRVKDGLTPIGKGAG